ncbi:MAG: hypothetical protein FWD94_03135, partial [Treponema sp.]|nr:hypothetical protein [Treponema sp.]
MKNIAVFASGEGTDLQAIIDACREGRLDAAVCAVVGNRAGSGALRRAAEAGIPAFLLDPELDGEILELLLR